MAVSDTIRTILEIKGISQVELANELDTSKQNISNKLARNTFSPEELSRIAEIFGYKLGFINESAPDKVVCYEIDRRKTEPAETSYQSVEWQPIEEHKDRSVSPIHLTGADGESLEHSMVITNFVSVVNAQLKGRDDRAFPNNIRYVWQTKNGEWKSVRPDASITSRFSSRCGTSVRNNPYFVLEVISPVTEKYDRTEKMALYECQQIPELWIVDWRNRVIEIYYYDAITEYEGTYRLLRTITESNKDQLHMLFASYMEINFDQLFDVEF